MMNVYNDFLKSIFYVYVYYLRLLKMMGLYTFKPEITVLDKEHDFFNKKQDWFLKKIEKMQRNEGKDCNSNIDAIFYNKIEFETYMNHAKCTDLEQIWKNRISLVSTPRGNVMMYYDPYKMGFSYHCDQSKLSYDILNACAMNYVIQHRCLNFYIDEMTSPNLEENIIAKNEIEEIKNSELKNKPMNKSRIGFTIQPVVSKMNPNIKSMTSDNKGTKELPKLKNKFIHVGKISNMNILNVQIIPKKNILFEKNMKSELMYMLEENANVQNEVLSYSDYKKMQNEKNM